MPTRPILAAKIDEIRGEHFIQHATKARPEKAELAQFPYLCTPKIDGIRAITLQNTLLSRSFKSIPNDHVRNLLSSTLPSGFDGELVLLDDTSHDHGAGFNPTQSGIMSEGGIPDFAYLVFDYCPDGFEHVPYEKRISILSGLFASGQLPPEARLVPSTLIWTPDHLLEYEETCLKEGYEGVCLRRPNSPYKSGRSTFSEGYLYKLKRFKDSEAKVINVFELERNTNDAFSSELGLLKRSTKAEGKVAGQTLGGLIVEDCTTGEQFRIGTGFTSAVRDEIWQNQDRFLGQILTYKFQDYGTKDKPRIPVFKGFRSIIDL